MKKVKSKTIVFLVVVLLFAIISGVLLYYYTEGFDLPTGNSNSSSGFYSNTSTSSAKSTLDDLLSNQMNTMMNTMKDITTNKYSLDITPVIANLGEEMKDSSSTTQIFIKNKKDELSNLQRNLNNINNRFVIFSNTKVNQLVSITDINSGQFIPLVDAIKKANDDLRRISNELSEIPV
jgi:hypothetical protein